MAINVYACQLRPGDICAGSGAVIHRVVEDGLYKRGQDDKWLSPRERWPRGKVEVVVSYPGSPPRLDYWNRRTVIQVQRGVDTSTDAR